MPCDQAFPKTVPVFRFNLLDPKNTMPLRFSIQTFKFKTNCSHLIVKLESALEEPSVQVAPAGSAHTNFDFLFSLIYLDARSALI